MQLFRRLSRTVSQLVALCLAMSALYVPSAQAGLVGTEVLVVQETEQKRQELRQLLAREDVRDKLEAWGVSPDDAHARVNSLSPSELEQMAAHMEDLPAGGDILGAAVFIFLVLLVTDILGYTEVFPFVKDVR